MWPVWFAGQTSPPIIWPMHRAPATLAAAALLVFTAFSTACATSPDRLPFLDRQFYENLPSPEAREGFLEVKKAERQAYLEKQGLWQQWAALSEAERDAVGERRVEVGHSQFAAHMSWGPPADVNQKTVGDRTVAFETFIRCTSGPKIGDYVRSNLDCDGTSAETILSIENATVTEIKHMD